ncbi:unnamed protein product [Trifolium pratense]|uniref:Uncharacterized protein n=1 Tax=Trifolium pratense TaxID=57577 RepID=A0ACB0JK61_TRIPR|nr:unnamed protein product [Trifolium pratense]
MFVLMVSEYYMFSLYTTNAWNRTFLLINDDIPPINDFKNRLSADNTYEIQSNIIQSSSEMISQSSFSGFNRSAEDKFILGHPVIKIKHIIKLPKDQIYCIKQCYGSTPPFECKDGHPTDEPILRYKIDIQIFDGDDSAKFIFLDDTCIDLLGKTSSQLRQKMLDLGFTDTSDYRKDIDDLMGRTFAFRDELNVGGNSFVNFIDNQDCHDEIQSIARFRTHFETLPSITIRRCFRYF